MTDDGFTAAEGPLRLHCIGVQFRDVPVSARDGLALSPAEVAEALATISIVLPAAEAVVLATCNRTELYVVEAGDPERLDLWHRTVGHRIDDDQCCPARLAARFHLTGEDAARHLLRVTAGLESAELGDTEIAGQVRRARDLAVDAGTVGPVLHRLFDLASNAGRRARSETLVSAGGSGVGLATAEVVLDRAPLQPVVAVVGAGDAANAICRELGKRCAAELRIVNRTLARAQGLADRHGGTAYHADDLVAALSSTDVVVLAVRGPHPVIDRRLLGQLRQVDPAWIPLVIDTCVPRMAAGDVDVDVVHLDDLAVRRDDVHRIRSEAVPEVEAIVADTLTRFTSWWRDRALRDVIAELYREAERLTAEAAGLVDDERVARQMHRAVRRLVHRHITRLRSVEAPLDDRTRKETHR